MVSSVMSSNVNLQAQIEQRATQTLEWAIKQLGPFDIGLDHLTLGRVQIYRALLEPTDPTQPPAETSLKQAQTHLDTALAKLREALTEEPSYE